MRHPGGRGTARRQGGGRAWGEDSGEGGGGRVLSSEDCALMCETNSDVDWFPTFKCCVGCYSRGSSLVPFDSLAQPAKVRARRIGEDRANKGKVTTRGNAEQFALPIQEG